MNGLSCENECDAKLTAVKTRLVVITGGPGAGKTAFLEIMRKLLCQHVALAPESASILFRGGFERLPSNSARRALQRAIFYVQCEVQNLIVDEHEWALALCDRGTLDGVAYWPGSAEDFETELKTDPATEYSKYEAVIHLCSPDLPHGYNKINPFRIETVEEAAQIDARIQAVWRKHPNYHQVFSTGDFLEKVETASNILRSFLPKCCTDRLNFADLHRVHHQ